MLLMLFRCTSGAHGAMSAMLRQGMATKIAPSKAAAAMAVVRTEDARSAGD
jgi:hypothetical protein